MRFAHIWPHVTTAYKKLSRPLPIMHSTMADEDGGNGLYEKLRPAVGGDIPMGGCFHGPLIERPSLVDAFAKATGFRRSQSLPCETADLASVLKRIHDGKQAGPVLLRGLIADWPAVRRWNREYILSRWGNVSVGAALGLPAHGVPFLEHESKVRREMTLRAFWNELQARSRCYLEQQALSALPGLEDDLRMAELLGPRQRLELNLWLGRGTRSGLHFDPADNFVMMIRGHKFVAMASSAEGARLYPFLDTIMKSRVDVERPDFVRFPRALDVEMQIGWIAPGDVLYIPAGWWHYVSSPTDDHHISVNCWFGPEQSLSFLASRVVSLGPRYAVRVLQDFLLGGVLGQPVEARFHSLPDGVKLYRTLRARWRRGDSARKTREAAAHRSSPHPRTSAAAAITTRTTP